MSNDGEANGLEQRIAREAASLQPTRLTPEAVQWGAGPDPARFWIPEAEAPLFGAPSYGELTGEQRRRYNQYYALQKTEQFIWLERYLIIVPLARLLRTAIPNPDLRRLLESFMLDEEQHNASLRHLIAVARPDLYAGRTFRFFMPPLRFRVIASAMTRLPRLLSSWVLFVGALEEQTITTSQSYRRAGHDVDPLFSTVYKLHAQDEARHCKLDTLIADWLIDSQGGLARAANGRALDLAFQAYYDPNWGCDTPILALVSDFPELKPRQDRMIAEAMRARSPEFARNLVNSELAPITARNVERFEMLGRALRRVLGPGIVSRREDGGSGPCGTGARE